MLLHVACGTCFLYDIHGVNVIFKVYSIYNYMQLKHVLSFTPLIFSAYIVAAVMKQISALPKYEQL